MFNRFGLIDFEAVPLERFGLEKKWRKLATLQNEAAGLIQQYQSAEREVPTLEQGRQAARDKDLDAHAQAIRKGSAIPEPEAEAKLDQEIAGAVRTRDALQRATEGAIADANRYRAEHAGAIQRDVAQALEGVAAKLAEHARAAALYGEYESGTQEARRLVPPPPAEENHSGPQDSTVILGPLTRQTASFAGPNPGEVQRVLSYLASLGAESSSSEATPAA